LGNLGKYGHMELQVGVVNYMYQGEGAYLGGGGGNRFSDRRIPPKKLFGFRIWRIFYTDLRILLQRIADLSNILARIVDFARNLVRILDCDFIVELLADPNLDKAIVGRRILLRIWADRRICIPLFPPPPPVLDEEACKLCHFTTPSSEVWLFHIYRFFHKTK
jgi:hypothetical protein